MDLVICSYFYVGSWFTEVIIYVDFFSVFLHPSSNRNLVKPCETSLKKHGYCCSLTRHWVSCWILSLLQMSYWYLISYLKVQVSRVYVVSCFQAQQAKFTVNINSSTSLSGSLQSSFIAFLVNSSPCADQELETGLPNYPLVKYSQDLSVTLGVLRLLVYSLQSLKTEVGQTLVLHVCLHGEIIWA